MVIVLPWHSNFAKLSWGFERDIEGQGKWGRRLAINPGRMGNETMATIIGTNGNEDGVDNATLDGGSGDDLIQGLDGNDTLNGNDGNDTLEGGAGDDTLNGGTSNDILVGGAGADALDGSSGTDTASYIDSDAAVTITITGFNTTGSGGYATGDTFFSIESIIGSAYADTLTSNSSVGIIEGAGGADAISGAVRASYSLSDAGVTVALDVNGDGTGVGGHAQGDTLTGIVGLIGSAYGDTLSIASTANRTLVGGGGDDFLTLGSGDDRLDGGSGDDTMTGGAGNDVYYVDSTSDVVVELSGGGTDRVMTSVDYTLPDEVENLWASNSFTTTPLSLRGNALANSLAGGNGVDTLEGGAGADVLDGGGGFDVASYQHSSAGVTVNLTTGAASGGDAEGDTLTNIERLTGSAFNDVLTGDSLMNILDGGDGDDLLEGRASADTLIGGDGIDTVTYANSAFLVYVDLAAGTGGANDAHGDTLSGIENVIGSVGNDILTGNDDDNVLDGAAANDTLNGGLGDDTLIGGAGADVLNGGSGFDTADYTASAAGVTVNLGGVAGSGGDAQGDTFSAMEAVIGSAFDDILTGTAAANTLTGGDGDDTLVGGSGGDTLDGGDGTDRVSYAASASRVIVDLGAGTGSGGDAAGDVLTAIENVTGSAFNDILVGGAGDNVLDGGDGNDILVSGAGADTLEGGDGIDTVTYKDSAAGITVDLLMGTASGGDAAGDMLTAIENVTGSGLTDALTGDGATNRLFGLDGDDVLSGGDSRDVLTGGNGADTLNGDNGNDALKGEAGDDIINGGAGNDSLNGGAGSDTLTGGSGNDSYFVDSGSDTITELEGEGDDRVTSTAASYALSDHIETLVLAGAAASGMGNDQDNTIRGNGLDNTLIGKGGIDRLVGGDGADTLIGGADDDQLFGGAGADIFVFGQLGAEGVDRINDWEEGDLLQIKLTGFGVTGLETVDILTGTSTAGLTGNVLFYESTTGKLYFHDGDSDVLTQFATLTTRPADLDIGDFALV